MLKVLVNSYACCPDMGSEPGMGWNWLVCIAQYCEVYVITEGEFRPQIEKWMAIPENADLSQRMHFYWNPVSEKVRTMCWNQGNWAFYKYYREWQLRTADIAREILAHEKIDILHQLNMIGFREPGYLWKVSQETGVPFVWGPVGGMKQFPMAYASGLKMKIFNRIKNTINWWQMRYDRRVTVVLRQASLLISSIPDSQRAIRRYHGLDSVLIPETGCGACGQLPLPQGLGQGTCPHDSLKVMWVGKFDFRKRLDIAIRSAIYANDAKSKLPEDTPRIDLYVYGTGNEGQVADAKALAGGDSHICFMGQCEHVAIVEAMRRADILLFTSVSEDTSTVVLEAVSNGLPVVCFDACGMAHVINQYEKGNDGVGIKIPLTNPEQSVVDFASVLVDLNLYRDKLQAMSVNCVKRAEELSWENKAKKILALYKSIK